MKRLPGVVVLASVAPGGRIEQQEDDMGVGARRTAVAGTTALVGLVGLVLLTTAGCSGPGDLEIANNGPEDVVVRTGDEVVDVTSGGGAALLGYGCTPGDVTVEFPSADPVVLPGPVCPGQEIRVGDGTAHLLPTIAPDDDGSDGSDAG